MYSIGSSIVRMCSWRSALILSIIAASVVDLPLPVGPVTSTRPRGRSASVAEDRRQAEVAERANLLGNQTVDGADRAALVEDVAAEAREPADAEREVELAASPRSASSARRSARCRRAPWFRPASAPAAPAAAARRARAPAAACRSSDAGRIRPSRPSSSADRAASPSTSPSPSTTSSTVVTPSITLRRPLRRSVIMPSSIALRRSSRPDAPTRISSRSSSLISITSYRPTRPL